jgi:hypothetical protein
MGVLLVMVKAVPISLTPNLSQTLPQRTMAG